MYDSLPESHCDGIPTIFKYVNQSENCSELTLRLVEVSGALAFLQTVVRKYDLSQAKSFWLIIDLKALPIRNVIKLIMIKLYFQGVH